MVCRVAVTDGHADSVTIENVPSFTVRLDDSVEVPGYGTVPYSLAFGGNFYALVHLDAVGLDYDRANQQEILAAGLAIMAAINASDPPHHPEIAGIDHCHHVEFIAPGSTAQYSRHAMAIYPGWFDRSPCGTGTCARMAELYSRGELALGEDFVNESFIGSSFTGRLIARDDRGGHPGGHPDHHRPGLGHRDRAVPARPHRSVPHRLPVLTGRNQLRWSSSARACEAAYRHRISSTSTKEHP